MEENYFLAESLYITQFLLFKHAENRIVSTINLIRNCIDRFLFYFQFMLKAISLNIMLIVSENDDQFIMLGKIEVNVNKKKKDNL